MSMISYQVETFGTPLAQKLREIPQPQGREVVLRIGSCGVCHSDVHLHDGYFDLGGGHKLDMSRTVQAPRTLGHEIAGTVVAVGPDAQGVAVGDRLAVCRRPRAPVQPPTGAGHPPRRRLLHARGGA